MRRGRKLPDWMSEDKFTRPSLSGRLRSARPAILEVVFFTLFVVLPAFLIIFGILAIWLD